MRIDLHYHSSNVDNDYYRIIYEALYNIELRILYVIKKISLC
jgi:hypothetical protein